MRADHVRGMAACRVAGGKLAAAGTSVSGRGMHEVQREPFGDRRARLDRTHAVAALVEPRAVEPDAELPVGDVVRPVARLLADLDPADRAGVRPTDLVLHS